MAPFFFKLFEHDYKTTWKCQNMLLISTLLERRANRTGTTRVLPACLACTNTICWKGGGAVDADLTAGSQGAQPHVGKEHDHGWFTPLAVTVVCRSLLLGPFVDIRVAVHEPTKPKHETC
jgi:hypothetical protein